MKRWITFYILFILMLGSLGTKAFALPSESFGSPRAPLHYVSSFSNAVKNDYSSRWNSGDIREMGSVVGEGLITLLAAGVKYADNAGRLGKTGAFIQKLRKIKNLKRLRKLKAQKKIQVTSWADKGIKPDFNSGRWVMKGGPTKVNFWKSGLPGPKVVKSSKFPYFHIQKSQADFSNFITKEVPRTSLKLPPGPEIIKAPLGQRILKGGN